MASVPISQHLESDVDDSTPGPENTEMATSWVFLTVCWYLQFIAARAHGTQASSSTATSLGLSAGFALLPSTAIKTLEYSVDSRASSGIKPRTTPGKELVLSGTYHHEGVVPITTSSPVLRNGTASQRPTPTVTHLNGTKTTKNHCPTNTQPCNLHTEFCGRSYGNITYVGAHNSPFIRENNAAANQHLDVVTQLNDGVRLVQGQTHMANGSMYLCHTSCDILNAGKLEYWLSDVADWLRSNPFEVVTILVGNGDYVDVGNYIVPMKNSGIADMAYVPPQRNIKYDQWPTLSEIIMTGHRAVVFMDYKADENQVPYILDEFSYIFETPFSQTNDAFPCNIDRPPEQPKDSTQGKLYMANHNLNVELDIVNKVLLIPNTVAINQTNAVSGFGSLGAQAMHCEAMWQRYPNFLLVDFYDAGEGSVFEVAAKANNVTYNRKCCGKRVSGALQLQMTGWYILIIAIVVSVFL